MLSATIAEFLYPAAQHRLDGEPYNAFVARIKALFHKEVLAPLRRCLDVPEVPSHLPIQVLQHAALSIVLRTHAEHVHCTCTACSACALNLNYMLSMCPRYDLS